MLTASDYNGLFQSCILTLTPPRSVELDYIARVVLTNQYVYKGVAFAAKVPWFLVAAIHFRESNQNFTCHLHNGDPLTARTVRVPAGRPANGSPPFDWGTSAIDAFSQVWKPSEWDMAASLEFVERYNGLGYQKHSVNTPYLWDYTNHYVTGLYQSDGMFNPNAREMRPGVVAILKTLEVKGVSLDFTNLLGITSLLH